MIQQVGCTFWRLRLAAGLRFLTGWLLTMVSAVTFPARAQESPVRPPPANAGSAPPPLEVRFQPRATVAAEVKEPRSPDRADSVPISGVQLARASASGGRLDRPGNGIVNSHASLLDSQAVELPVLDGHDIGCRAAQNWLPSELLRARARTLLQLFCEEDDCTRQAAQALACFLNMQAKHQEDIGAATALRAYYTRIALAEQLTLSTESLHLVARQLAQQEALHAGGLPAGTDWSAFDRRRIEITDKQYQLHSQDRQLRSVLAQIADADYATDRVRQERLEVLECSLACDRLKQQALGLRQDLRGWIYLSGQVNDQSAPLFAKMFTTIVGGWGLPLPSIVGLKNLICPPDYSCLATNMRREMSLAVETHTRWICQAVDEKCHKLQLAYQRLQLARQTIDSWMERLAQLEKLGELGDGQPEQTAIAQAGLLQARSEEISRRLEARIAEIDLAEATGGLADRCCAGQPWLLTGYE